MQDKHEAIISTINSITSSLTSLRELLKDPSDVYFGRLHPAFEHLETVMSKKTTVDAAFAFIAARDDAGRVVGSSKPEDYLTARLGLTYAEAQSRIKTGQSLFAPLAEVSPLNLHRLKRCQWARKLAMKSASEKRLLASVLGGSTRQPKSGAGRCSRKMPRAKDHRAH